MLLSMLPVALPPPGLRDQLFLIDDMGPAASAYRAGVVHRAGPFGWSGFPEPLDPPHADHRPKTRALAAGVAALALFAGDPSAPLCSSRMRGITPPPPVRR